MVDAWRACHAAPINTFKATLHDTVRHKYPNTLVAQRLKRLGTIIDKLNREPTMQLTTMQDIGGLRAVVQSNTHIYKLVEEYRAKKFSHELKAVNDYIQSPKKDGYRGVHLVYKYKKFKNRNSDYDDLLLELQIRTNLQHLWATAVETMGKVLDEPLKFIKRKGDKQWEDFFKVASAAFAQKEGTSSVPGFEGLNKKQTYQALATAEQKLNALMKMRSLHRVEELFGGKGHYYHLLLLHTGDNPVIEVHSYRRTEAKKASVDYAKAEARAAKGEKIDPVLVAVGTKELRAAYPSYFLNVDEFAKEIEEIIKESKR